MVTREEIEELEKLLRDELSHARIDPVKISEEIAELRQEVESAGNLIDSLKQDLAAEHKRNEDLRKQIESLNKEYVTRKIVEKSCRLGKGRTAVSGPELEEERRRRKIAEMELEAYKKQHAKAPDAVIAANARRVAITLARHCVELNNELNKYRTGTLNSPPVSLEEIKAALVPKSTPAVKPVAPALKVPTSGWGSAHDDDDLFSALN